MCPHRWFPTRVLRSQALLGREETATGREVAADADRADEAGEMSVAANSLKS